MKYAEAHQYTHEAMCDPQPGDRFHEMYSYWIYVVARAGKWVTTIESNPPYRLHDGEARIQTVSEFKKRFEYDSIPNRYCVLLRDRGNDISWWVSGSKLTG